MFALMMCRYVSQIENSGRPSSSSLMGYLRYVLVDPMYFWICYLTFIIQDTKRWSEKFISFVIVLLICSLVHMSSSLDLVILLPHVTCLVNSHPPLFRDNLWLRRSMWLTQLLKSPAMINLGFKKFALMVLISFFTLAHSLRLFVCMYAPMTYIRDSLSPIVIDSWLCVHELHNLGLSAYLTRIITPPCVEGLVKNDA